VHEKFIYRNGKKYGPYLYENHRVGGKVVTSYVGRTTPTQGPHVHTMPVLLGGMVLLFLLFGTFDRYPTTGFATFEVTTLTEGLPLEGLFAFSLTRAPSSDASVTLFVGNVTVTRPFEDIVEGISVSREARFQYRIISDLEEEVVEEQEQVAESESVIVEEEGFEDASDEVLAPLPEIEVSEEEHSFITGNVIAEEEVFEGSVREGTPFILSLESGEQFELISGSIVIDEAQVADSALELTSEGREIQVALGTLSSLEYTLDLGVFDQILTSGILGITIVEGDETLLQESIFLDFGKASLVQRAEFPVFRMLPGEQSTLDLGLYFAGVHEATFLSSVLEGSFNGTLLTFSVPASFSGSAQGIVRMMGGEGVLVEEAFTVLVSSGEVSVVTSRERIVVGEPVVWIVNVSTEGGGNVTVSVPVEATNVSLIAPERSISEIVSSSVILQDDVSLTQETLHEALLDFVSEGITRNVIADDVLTQEVTFMSNDSASFIVTYVTPAPTATELVTSTGKTITISGPESLEYTDVIASTTLDASFKGTPILYWEDYSAVSSPLKSVEAVENVTLLEDALIAFPLTVATPTMHIVPYDGYDLDFDGQLDYLEWVVPHLSNQTFHLIYVSFAGYYSLNGTFLADITSEVRVRDGIFTSALAPEHIVRITFEENVTASQDITLFARSLGNATSLRVLDSATGTEIAFFDAITEYRKYRFFLSALTHPQATFDLVIQGAPLEIDYIVDPHPSGLILYPENSTYAYAVSELNYTLSEVFVPGSCAYSLDGGVTNTSITCGENVTGLSAVEGSNTWTLFTVDSLGDENRSIVTFSVDTSALTVTRYLPHNISYNSIVPLNVTTSKSASCNYSLDAGETNYTLQSNGGRDFNGTTSGLAEQIFFVSYYCFATSGGSNLTVTGQFTYDQTAPTVTIVRPENTTYTSLPLYFNISLNENGTAWYSLNNGVTNYTMTSNSSSTGFNATNASIANGSYTFNAYANDSAGNVNFSTMGIIFSVAVNTSNGSSGGSGGGSSSSSSTKKTTTTTSRVTTSAYPLTFSVKQFDVEVKKGQRSLQTLTIKNKGSTEVTVQLTMKGATPTISISEPIFTLASGASKEITLTIITTENSVVDSYALTLQVVTNGVTKEIPLIVVIKELKALFDISASLEKRIVPQGGRLGVILDLLNVGDAKQADVVMEYFIQPFGGEKEKIYEDTFAVDTKQKRLSDIFLPGTLAPGEYLLSVKMTYGQSTATAAVKFTIIERSLAYLRTLLISGLLLAIILVGILLVVISRTAKNESPVRQELPIGVI